MSHSKSNKAKKGSVVSEMTEENSSVSSAKEPKKGPSFTSAVTEDDRERRDGPGGN